MTQVWNRDIEDAALDAYYKVKIFSYDASGNVIYMSCNRVHTAATSGTDWKIWKFTYDAAGQVTMSEGPLVGSYDGRAALEWRA